MAGYHVVKSIHVKDNPFSVTVDMTGKAPVKVVRIGKREVLVAIKNASLAKGLVIGGKDNPNLKSVHVETLEGNVVALMVTSKHASQEKIKSSFDSANNRLTVVLNNAVTPASPVPQAATTPKPSPPGVSKPEKQASAPATEPMEKQTLADGLNEPAVKAPALRPETASPPRAQFPDTVKKKDTSPAKANESIKEPPLYTPPERQASRFKGDISDM